MIREITALNHKVLNHTVERRALVAVSVLTRRELLEVLRRLRRRLPVQSHDNPSRGFAPDFNIKEHLVRHRRSTLRRVHAVHRARREQHAHRHERQSTHGEHRSSSLRLTRRRRRRRHRVRASRTVDSN